MTGKGKRGFTLIELLVVIAIIAILAAILFPVFSSAKIAAKQSQCISNMGELGKILLLYTQDSGGKLPYWYDWVAGKTWDTYLYKYVRNGKIFTCPNNCVGSNKRGYPGGTLIRSYAMPKNVSGVLYGMAPRSTMTVMLFEKGSQPFGAYSDAVAEWYTQTWGYAQSLPDKFWHGPGKVFLFCDGHAKFFRYAAGPFSYNYPSFEGWSGQPSVANNGGIGYCGWVDNTSAGGTQDNLALLTGANIPR